MNDKVKAWLVVAALILGTAEYSDAPAVPPPTPNQWGWANQWQQQRESDADFYARQNYFMLQQQQYENYLQKRQYEQDRRNAQEQERMELMMGGFR